MTRATSIRHNHRVATTREPGWYPEPGDDTIERKWTADGPTALLRFRDELPTDGPETRRRKHPYRDFGLRWWLKEVPIIGWLYFPVFVKRRDDAARNGELTPSPGGQLTSRYVAFLVVCGAGWVWYLWVR